jgi:hypothetical protein
VENDIRQIFMNNRILVYNVNWFNMRLYIYIFFSIQSIFRQNFSYMYQHQQASPEKFTKQQQKKKMSAGNYMQERYNHVIHVICSRISRYYVKWLFISSFKWRTRSVENDIRQIFMNNRILVYNVNWFNKEEIKSHFT